MKELGVKMGMLVGFDLPLADGETDAGSDPHTGAIV